MGGARKCWSVETADTHCKIGLQLSLASSMQAVRFLVPESRRKHRRYSIRSLRLVSSLVAATAGGAIVLSCGGSDSSASRNDERWTVLDRMEGGSSAYSLSFVSEPPAGAFWRILVYEPTEETGCARTAHALYESTGTFWVLALELGTTEIGEYSVVSRLSHAAPEAKARAELYRVVDRKKTERYVALSGTITVQQGTAAPDGWGAGVPLRARARLEFPEEAVETRTCSGSASRTGEAVNTCECVREDLSTFTCEGNASDEAGCCYDLSAKRRTIEVTIDAEQCSLLCVYSAPELETYCQTLMQ